MGCGSSNDKGSGSKPTQKSSGNTDATIDALYAGAGTDGKVSCVAFATALEKDKATVGALIKERKPVNYLIEHLKSEGDKDVTLKEIKDMLNDSSSLESLFCKCDLNGDGQLTSTELAEALEQDKTMVDVFKKAGKPIDYVMDYLKEHNQQLSLDEFRDMLHDDSSFEALFARCDLNGDKQLSQDEISTALSDSPELVAKMHEANMPVEKLLEYLKANNKDKITLADFRELIHTTLAAPAAEEAKEEVKEEAAAPAEEAKAE